MTGAQDAAAAPAAVPAAVPAGPAPVEWDRRERLLAGAAGVGMLLQTLRYYLHLPFLGYLLTRPLRYLAVYPSTVGLVVGGAYARTGRDPLVLVLLLGLVSYEIVGPLRWLAGARYGDHVARLLAGGRARSGSGRDMVTRVERFVARWGSWALVLGWFAPVPVLLLQVAAGASGMSLRRFVLCDTTGTLLWVGTVTALGYVVGEPAVRTVQAVGHYGLYVTIAAVLVVVVVAVLRTVRAGRAASPPA